MVGTERVPVNVNGRARIVPNKLVVAILVANNGQSVASIIFNHHPVHLATNA
jgi:hypothetical protein